MDDETKVRPLAVSADVSALASPFLYCLSTGPVVWLQGRGWIHPDATRQLFTPLIWLCYRVDPINNLVNSYIDLWR